MSDNEVLEYIKQSFELKSKGFYKQAIEMLYKALDLENDNNELLFQLGELYFLLNNYQRSLQYLEKIVEDEPFHYESLILIKKIYLREQRYSGAKEIALKLFEHYKSSVSLAELIEILGKLKETVDFEKYLSLDIADKKVKFAVAKAYFENSELEKAKNILEDFSESDNDELKILLGKIYFDENNFEKSRVIFESFSATSSNPEILNYRGLFAIEDMKFIDAIKYFAKAASLNNQNAKYLFNLANAYFYNGWFEESSKTYQKAICLDPENIDYRYALAYLYYEEKSFEKARKEVDVILGKNKDYSQAIVLDALLKLESKDFLGAQNELETNLEKNPNDSFTKSALSKTYLALNLYEKAEKIVNDLIRDDNENLSLLSDLCEIYIADKKYDDALKIVESLKVINENYITAYVLGAKAAYYKKDLELAKEYAQEAIALDMNCAEGYYYLALVRFDSADCDEAVECMKRAIMHDLNNPAYYAKMSEIYKVSGDFKTAIDYIKEAESIDNSTEYKIMYSELVSLNRKSQKVNKV